MQVAMRASAALSVALLLAAATAPAAAVLNSGGVTAMSLRGPVLNALGQPLLTPSNFTMLGRAVYYEIPVRPVAVLALFHGCAHDSNDFWPRAACADCDGELLGVVGGWVVHGRVFRQLHCRQRVRQA